MKSSHSCFPQEASINIVQFSPPRARTLEKRLMDDGVL